jgi:hypothetical protein
MINEIDFDANFMPIYGATITIPANSLIWRGFDPAYPAIQDRPAYYGSRQFAQGYAEKYDIDAKPFITSRPLQLLDIRYMKVLLSQLFEDNERKPGDKEIVIATSVSFGLCSLHHQIELFKYRYKQIFESNDSSYNSIKKGFNNLNKLLKPSYYEQKGVRIAETTNDAFVMGFLKELFSSNYDGFISPNILSPFHVEKTGFILNSELIIFNPVNSGIKLLLSLPSAATIRKTTINNLILHSGSNLATLDTRGMNISYYAIGGGSSNVCNDYNHEIDKGNKSIIKLFKKGETCGKRWINKNVKLHNSIAPGPEVNPLIFTEYNNIDNGNFIKHHNWLGDN